MSLLGALAAFIFAITIPIIYGGFSIYSLHDHHAVEAAFLAKSIEEIIQDRPDMWEFESVRLLEIISQPSIHGEQAEREINTAAGMVVAKTDFSAARPVISVSAAFFDSGRPVGSIVARYTIRTQILITALLGILSSFIGYLIYFIFRNYPIRRLENTLADLQRAEEEQHRNRETAEQLANEMAVIADIGRLISSTLDIEEVYERFAAEARKLIPFDRIAVNLCNIHEGTLTVAYVSGADVPHRKQGDSPPLAGTLTEEVLRGRTGLIIQPESIDEIVNRIPALSHSFQMGLRSLLSVPLISRDEVIGVLHFRSKKRNAYTEQDLRLAERIGAQIAGAIANAQLFTDLKGTEKSRRESESRFRAIFEQAAVGVAEVEMNTGRFLTVNRHFCEILDRTEEEMLATTFLAITHPDDLRLHEEKTALLRDGKIRHYNLEKRYLRKDGGIVWVNLTTSPLWKPKEAPTRNLIVVQDITERKRMEVEIREMSLRDQMTELYNRRGFITLAEQQIRAANRAQRQMLLTFIDCDGLKGINDTFGHEEGDKSLIDAANVLRQTFRESDIIARLGGDEFAILAIDSADMNPETLSKRLQQDIDEFNAKKSRQYKLAMSWGAVIYNPESPLSLDELISAADELMYAQKKAKSNKRM